MALRVSLCLALLMALATACGIARPEPPTNTTKTLLNVLKSADTGGEVWLDDVTINGETEDFTQDPGWEEFQNRRDYLTHGVRPRFDFGFSPTGHAGGGAAGELGGLIFRGDCRYAERMAAYGDRIETLGLDQRMLASGKVTLRRGVSDSTVLIGFYHSADCLAVTDSQRSGIPANFVGVSIEGPSREGFFFYPMYRFGQDVQGYADGVNRPRIFPDGATHDWGLEYRPPTAEGQGAVTVTLDQQSVTLELPGELAATRARFDRFGIVTTWVDGNAQEVYFDDLTYTAR